MSGLWHGANWTFLVWGAYHAILFLPLILAGKNRKHTNQVAEGRFLPTWKETGQMLLTFFLALIGWIVFRAESIVQAWGYIQGMTDGNLFRSPWIYNSTYMLPMPIILLVFIVLEWTGRNKECPLKVNGTKKIWQWLVYILFVVMIFSFGKPAESFIYFQF